MSCSKLFKPDEVDVLHSLPMYNTGTSKVYCVYHVYRLSWRTREVQDHGAVQHKLWDAREMTPKAPLLTRLISLVDGAFLEQQGPHLRAALLISKEDPHILSAALIAPH